MPPRSKKPATIPSTIPATIPALTPVETPVSDLDAFLSTLPQANGVRVDIYVEDPVHGLTALASEPLATFDHFAVGAKYGRGTYRFQFKDAQRKYLKQISMTLHGPEREHAPAYRLPDPQPLPVPVAIPTTAPVPAPVAQPPVDVNVSMFTAVCELVKALNPSRAPVVADGAVTMKDILPFIMAERKSSPVTEILAGMKQMKGLVDEGRPAVVEGEESELVMILKAVGPAFSDFLREQAAEKRAAREAAARQQVTATVKSPKGQLPPNAPATTETTSPAATPVMDETPVATDEIGELLAVLEMGAKKEGDPSIYADLIADSIDETAENMIRLFQPLELVDMLLQRATEKQRAVLEPKKFWLANVASILIDTLNSPPVDDKP